MGPNRRRLEREEAHARAAQRRKEEERRAADVAEAAHIIEAWNDRLASGRRALFPCRARATPGRPRPLPSAIWHGSRTSATCCNRRTCPPAPCASAICTRCSLAAWKAP